MEPHHYKVRRREQENVWNQIAYALKLISTEIVRERCASLINPEAEKEKSELKQSGISPEDTPLDEAIKNIIDKIQACEIKSSKIRTIKMYKEDKKKKTAEDMRSQAIESLAESKARKRASLSHAAKNKKKLFCFRKSARWKCFITHPPA